MLRVGEVVSISMLQWRRRVAEQREEAGGQQAEQLLRQMAEDAIACRLSSSISDLIILMRVCLSYGQYSDI